MEPAEITEITLWTVIILGLIWNMISSHNEKERPKRLAIIEDNDDDFRLLKYFCEFDNNIIIDRYRTADNLLWKFMFKRPDAVLADFYLEGQITGDRVLELCDKLRIQSLLVTGNTQPMDNVPENRILRKTAGTEYFMNIQTWVKQQLA